MLPAVRQVVMGGGVKPETAALIARFTTPPTAARKTLINNFWKAAGIKAVMAKLDFAYMFAAADAQAARQNWVQDLYHATTVSSPTFAADRGYTGNGSTSYLKTGFIPSAAAGKFALNDASFGFWSRTNIDHAGVDIGARTNGTTALTYIQARTSGVVTYRLSQDATANTVLVADSLGLTSARRSGSGAQAVFKNGASVGTNTTASTALADVEIYICGLNSANVVAAMATRQYAFAFGGGSLSDAEMLTLYNAVNTYLQAVGAA